MGILGLRRSDLLTIVAMLAVVNASYALVRAGNRKSDVTRVVLSWSSVIRPEAEMLPSLSAAGWAVEGKREHDLWRYARTYEHGYGRAWNEAKIAYISLGPQPTFAQFLASVGSLRKLGVCHVGVRHERKFGKADFGPPWGVQQGVEFQIMGLCGGDPLH